MIPHATSLSTMPPQASMRCAWGSFGGGWGCASRSATSFLCIACFVARCGWKMGMDTEESDTAPLRPNAMPRLANSGFVLRFFHFDASERHRSDGRNRGPLRQAPVHYDANGNMLSGDGIRSYQWDAENRLIEIDYLVPRFTCLSE